MLFGSGVGRIVGIVLHYYWQGCSLAETAQQIGRTPAAVAGLLHRGLRTLRGLLNESE